jgi:rhodanese-related sulfurtransferase
VRQLYLGFIILLAAASVGDARAQSVGILGATIGEPDQKTPEVSTEYVRRIIADRTSVLIDTRPRAEFVNGHIPTAHNPNVPPSDTIRAVDTLVGGDKSKELVLYCNGPFCQASRRMADQLLDAGFKNVRRYQLGMPVWRALGGPTQLELEGATRIYKNDQSAIFLDARSAEDFAKGSLSRAQNLTPDQARAVQGNPMPLDDFNTRIVVFGRDAAEARALADALGKRPWHNVAYVAANFSELSAEMGSK